MTATTLAGSPTANATGVVSPIVPLSVTSRLAPRGSTISSLASLHPEGAEDDGWGDAPQSMIHGSPPPGPSSCPGAPGPGVIRHLRSVPSGLRRSMPPTSPAPSAARCSSMEPSSGRTANADSFPCVDESYSRNGHGLIPEPSPLIISPA